MLTSVPERWGRGAEARPPCAYSLDAMGDSLVFSTFAPCPAGDRSLFAPPGFIAGLWQMDCAELFLRNPRNGRYVEFNLGPGGAWWACGFVSPRTAMPGGNENWPMEEVRAKAAWEQPQWLGELSIPFQAVARSLDSWERTEWTGNITFLVGAKDGRRYFSVAELPGERPDFHQPDCWPNLEQITRPGIHG